MRVLPALWLAPVAALAVATAVQAAPTEILASDFGLFIEEGPQAPTFKPTTTVPYEGQPSYGWMMLLKTDKPTVHWREEFTLPAPAATWGQPDAAVKVSKDARTSVTERDVEPVNGVILNAWKVAEGDPKGHYVMRVIVDGQAERRFEFDVR